MRKQSGPFWPDVSISSSYSSSLLILFSDKLHNCDVMIREDVRTEFFFFFQSEQVPDDWSPDNNGRIHRCSYRHTKIYSMSVCVSERLPLKGFERTIYNFLDVYNKIDAIGLEQVNKIARQPQSLVISCEMGLK